MMQDHPCQGMLTIRELTVNLEKDEVACNQVYTKVSSTDDTCYPIYMRPQVTTLGPVGK